MQRKRKIVWGTIIILIGIFLAFLLYNFLDTSGVFIEYKYKQKIIIEPQEELSNAEFYDLEMQIGNRLNVAEFREVYISPKGNGLIIRFNNYDKEKIKEVLVNPPIIIFDSKSINFTIND